MSAGQGKCEGRKAWTLQITVGAGTNQMHETWLVGVCEGSERLKDKHFSKLGRPLWGAVAVKMVDSMESSVLPTPGKICALYVQNCFVGFSKSAIVSKRHAALSCLTNRVACWCAQTSRCWFKHLACLNIEGDWIGWQLGQAFGLGALCFLLGRLVPR